MKLTGLTLARSGEVVEKGLNEPKICRKPQACTKIECCGRAPIYPALRNGKIFFRHLLIFAIQSQVFPPFYSISLHPSSSLILEIMAADAQQSSSSQGAWHELGQARENLVKEAEAMYWTGLKFELAAAANSLHEMLSQDPPLEELIDGSSSFLSLPKRLSVRMRPYVEAWCSYYLQYAEYLPFRNQLLMSR